MSGIPRDKVVKLVKEKRTNQVTRGLRQGMLKSTVDKLITQVVDPLTEKLIPKLHEIHPGFKVADPAVESFLRFALIVALAEILEAIAPLIAKTPGVSLSKEDAEAKMQAIAMWMRNYSGEMLGEQMVEGAMKLVPVVKDLLSQSDVSELLNAFNTEEHAQEVPQTVENAVL